MELLLKVRDGDGMTELRGDFPPSATILDALESFRASGGAPVPAYRHSCHHGSCGTCGALVNGGEALMCLTRLGSLGKDDGSPLTVELEPLRRATLISGIAALPGQALAGIPPDASYLAVSDGVQGDRAGLPPDPTGRDGSARVRFEACIECGLCSSSCPVAAPFIGPAALAAINRERVKQPGKAPLMLALAGRPDGAAACRRHLSCSRVCPQGVYPGKHIQLLRNELDPGKAYDAVAASYADAFRTEDVRPPEARAVRRAIAAAARELGRPLRVLELGCGPAQFLRAALAADPDGVEIARAVAVDASPAMIAQAGLLAESLPPAVRDRLEFRTLRSEEVSALAPAGPFDLVLSVLSLRYANWDAVMDALRIVAPGAAFFAIDMALPDRGPRASLAALPGLGLEALRRLARSLVHGDEAAHALKALVGSEGWSGLVSRFPPRPLREYREFFRPRLQAPRVRSISRTPKAVVFSLAGRLP